MCDSNCMTHPCSSPNLVTKWWFPCGIEKHFLPRVNAWEVRIERGKDAKLCIIFSSAYFHPVLFPLLLFSLPPPSHSFSLYLSLSLSTSLALPLLQCFPTESDATTVGSFRGYSDKFKLSSKWFFSINASWRTPTSTPFVPSLNRSFSFFLLFSLTGDLSIPTRSIFFCLESNKVSDFRWRIQLISFGMRRVPVNASRCYFRGNFFQEISRPAARRLEIWEHISI